MVLYLKPKPKDKAAKTKKVTAVAVISSSESDPDSSESSGEEEGGEEVTEISVVSKAPVLEDPLDIKGKGKGRGKTSAKAAAAKDAAAKGAKDQVKTTEAPSSKAQLEELKSKLKAQDPMKAVREAQKLAKDLLSGVKGAMTQPATTDITPTPSTSADAGSKVMSKDKRRTAHAKRRQEVPLKKDTVPPGYSQSQLVEPEAMEVDSDSNDEEDEDEQP